MDYENSNKDVYIKEQKYVPLLYILSSWGLHM